MKSFNHQSNGDAETPLDRYNRLRQQAINTPDNHPVPVTYGDAIFALTYMIDHGLYKTPKDCKFMRRARRLTVRHMFQQYHRENAQKDGVTV